MIYIRFENFNHSVKMPIQFRNVITNDKGYFESIWEHKFICAN